MYRVAYDEVDRSIRFAELFSRKGVSCMYLAPAPLAPAAADLRRGALSLAEQINEKCAWLESADAEVHALLPEPDRRRRLLWEAEELERRYPDPEARPPLYGILVGVKDIIHVEG